MPNDTNIDTIPATAASATQAVIKADKAIANAVVDSVAKATARVAKAKRPAAKRATAKRATAKRAPAKRQARKTAAKVVAVKKITKRAAKTVRRAKAAPAAAISQFERISPMTYDFNQLFAGFQMPGADRFQTLFADAGSKGQEYAAKGQKAAEELSELTKANVEALVEAGRIAATGVKSIGQDAVASSRQGLEIASQNVKTLSAATSPTEYLQIQSELARASFDRFVAETSKLTEQMVKLAGEAIQPISNRASVNAERVNELMA